MQYFGTTRNQRNQHLNKTTKYTLKKKNETSVTSFWLLSIGPKVPLSEMCRSHLVNFCGQDGDVWELLNYRLGSWKESWSWVVIQCCYVLLLMTRNLDLFYFFSNQYE